MKIINFQSENIKRLVCVEIKPDGNMVQITGRNGSGKTSVLDSIYWAICGQANIQGNPIRQGENKARIRLDLGEIVVTRIFKKTDEGNTTSSITVENAEGTAIRQPQTMLDRLIGELSFDPLAFARMTKKEQFEQLKKFVPDIDFEAIDKAHQEDYDKRTNINRQASEAKILAKEIFVTIPENTQPIDESALVDELEAAGKHNTEIETRKARREQAQNEIQNKREEAKRLSIKASLLKEESVPLVTNAKRDGLAIVDDADKRAKEIIKEAQKRAEEIVTNAMQKSDALVDTATKEQQRLLNESKTFNSESETFTIEAQVIEKKLSEAPALPVAIDVAPIKVRISEAGKINDQIKLLGKRAEYLTTVEQYEADSDIITQRINVRQEDKRSKIAAAKLPVTGIGFGDGEILLNGVPFNQASDAEQLQISIAMAMALNPKLRVIRVRDGSLLDSDSLKMLEQMAIDQDYQVWIETIQGKCGFVLEDGHIKQHDN